MSRLLRHYLTNVSLSLLILSICYHLFVAVVIQDVFSENSKLYDKTLANFLCGEYKECITLSVY